MIEPQPNQQTAEISPVLAQDRSLGQILKEKRQNLKMEISEISTYLKIKSYDIEALENDDINAVTKHLYVLGLIRSYARFLKIDPREIEEKIKILPVKSNTDNKTHQLINLGESTIITPSRDSFFNFLLISILLFLVLLSIYNSIENHGASITNEGLIHELENTES
jgi:cytoskeleton protein RodZ